MPNRTRGRDILIIREGESLPTATLAHFLIRAIVQVSATEDEEYVCLRTAAGGYAWVGTTVSTYLPLTGGTITGNLTVGDAQTDTMTLVSHVAASGADPTIANTPDATFPGAGTTPSAVTVVGNDTVMDVSFTTGTTPATGSLFSVTFATARPSGSYGFFLARARRGPRPSTSTRSTGPQAASRSPARPPRRRARSSASSCSWLRRPKDGR